jgi:two-component system, chemotaxis family, response regulator Rcp1
MPQHPTSPGTSMSDGVAQARYGRRPSLSGILDRPVLILLDLNLPKMDGREVLAEVKGDIDLKTIPIVILTTSDTESDITRSYQLQANCYLTKPVRLEEFENLVKSVNDFWLTKVKLMNVAGVTPPTKPLTAASNHPVMPWEFR